MPISYPEYLPVVNTVLAIIVPTIAAGVLLLKTNRDNLKMVNQSTVDDLKNAIYARDVTIQDLIKKNDETVKALQVQHDAAVTSLQTQIDSIIKTKDAQILDLQTKVRTLETQVKELEREKVVLQGTVTNKDFLSEVQATLNQFAPLLVKGGLLDQYSQNHEQLKNDLEDVKRMLGDKRAHKKGKRGDQVQTTEGVQTTTTTTIV
jgi:hypothetical protein